MGITYYSCFWPLPTKLLNQSVAAAAFGFITMANLGGCAGPYAIGFLTDLTGTYVAGILLPVGTPSAPRFFCFALPLRC